jgi:hypothetical protein
VILVPFEHGSISASLPAGWSIGPQEKGLDLVEYPRMANMHEEFRRVRGRDFEVVVPPR